MIKRENRQLYITGQDEVIFSTFLFLMNLFLDEKNATRRDVNREGSSRCPRFINI